MRTLSRYLGVLAILLFTAMVLAQTNTGEVAGVLRDPSGAVIPNATITFTNLGTGLTRNVVSSSTGNYQLTALPIGRYEVTVSQSGFQPFKQQIQVTVGSRNALDIPLQVSGASTVVEVVGEGGATVNTIDQQQSDVVNSAQLNGLPTMNRDPYALVGLAGNVQADEQAGAGDMRGAGFSINGQRSASTSILLDGGENMDQFTATSAQPIPLDALQEFRVVTNGMTADGRNRNAPIVLGVFDDVSEIRIQKQVAEIAIALVGLHDAVEEFCAYDATTAPDRGDVTEIQIPVVLFAGGAEQLHALRIGNDFRCGNSLVFA